MAHTSSQMCSTTSPSRIGLAVAKKRAAAAELLWVSIAAVSVNGSYVVKLRHQILVAQIVGHERAGDPAFLDDQDAVRQPPDELEILLDEHDGEVRACAAGPGADRRSRR